MTFGIISAQSLIADHFSVRDASMYSSGQHMLFEHSIVTFCYANFIYKYVCICTILQPILDRCIP